MGKQESWVLHTDREGHLPDGRAKVLNSLSYQRIPVSVLLWLNTTWEGFGSREGTGNAGAPVPGWDMDAPRVWLSGCKLSFGWSVPSLLVLVALQLDLSSGCEHQNKDWDVSLSMFPILSWCRSFNVWAYTESPSEPQPSWHRGKGNTRQSFGEH